MNDLYGIDPAAPENLTDLSHLIGKFEVADGRFIADLPVPWISQVREKLRPLLSQEDFHEAVEWLRVASRSTLPTEVAFDSRLPWTENASSLIGKVVALVGPRGCNQLAVPIDKMLVERKRFPNASGGHIARTPTDYATVARPLLQTSPKIVLIDPFFKLRYLDERTKSIKVSSRHQLSLGALLSEAAKWRRVEYFELWVSPAQAFLKDQSEFENDLKSLVANCAPGVAWRYEPLDKQYSTDRHPRYLLGMERGLQFDWGFDIDNYGPTTNHVHWMGEEELKPLLQRFT